MILIKPPDNQQFSTSQRERCDIDLIRWIHENRRAGFRNKSYVSILQGICDKRYLPDKYK